MLLGKASAGFHGGAVQVVKRITSRWRWVAGGPVLLGNASACRFPWWRGVKLLGNVIAGFNGGAVLLGNLIAGGQTPCNGGFQVALGC